MVLEQHLPEENQPLQLLVWKNKVLSLENLEKRCCNRLPTATCVMCNAEIESVDHHFLKCSVAGQVWKYFVRLLQLPEPPDSMVDLWVS